MEIPKIAISAPMMATDEQQPKTPHKHHLQRKSTLTRNNTSSGGLTTERESYLDTGRSRTKDEVLHSRKAILKRIKNRQLREVDLTEVGPFNTKDFKKFISAIRDQQKPRISGLLSFPSSSFNLSSLC
eukprot:TRINITY_DN5246_c0_g1_i3.p1 TRINITY_DN5246_c0_g1~~TRINITY_DN5246_c0_g1_i3.p1  ORF type:complete len:128 (+),score=30.65 TRINITY_DN5246_c0_g1_i3:222-605(+)